MRHQLNKPFVFSLSFPRFWFNTPEKRVLSAFMQLFLFFLWPLQRHKQFFLFFSCLSPHPSEISPPQKPELHESAFPASSVPRCLPLTTQRRPFVVSGVERRIGYSAVHAAISPPLWKGQFTTGNRWSGGKDGRCGPVGRCIVGNHHQPLQERGTDWAQRKPKWAEMKQLTIFCLHLRWSRKPVLQGDVVSVCVSEKA